MLLFANEDGKGEKVGTLPGSLFFTSVTEKSEVGSSEKTRGQILPDRPSSPSIGPRWT